MSYYKTIKETLDEKFFYMPMHTSSIDRLKHIADFVKFCGDNHIPIMDFNINPVLATLASDNYSAYAGAYQKFYSEVYALCEGKGLLDVRAV